MPKSVGSHLYKYCLRCEHLHPVPPNKQFNHAFLYVPFCIQINPRQSRIVYEILRLGATNINNEADYTAYRLSVKKRLNIPYHKQRADLHRIEKSGNDIQMALASLPTKEERMEQLKDEYQAHEDEYRRILNRLELTQ